MPCHPLTFWAPSSEIADYNAAKGYPARNFNYSDRSSHPTIDSDHSGFVQDEEEEALLEASEITVLTLNDHRCQPPQACLASCRSSFFYNNCGPLIRRIINYPFTFIFKMGLSVSVFVFFWLSMNFGGALATSMLPRVVQNTTNLPLPDILQDYLGPYDSLPYCGHGKKGDWWFPGGNQALILNLLFTLVEGFYGNHGHVHVQRALHMSCFLFLFRTTVVGLTGMNNINTKPFCMHVQNTPMTYKEAFQYVLTSGWPFHACGDFIYSGHTALITVWTINIWWQKGIIWRRWYLKLWVLVQGVWGVFLLIACRSHYTVDVALAVYFAFFVSEMYYVRALGLYQGDSWLGKCIMKLEYWGEDWENVEKIHQQNTKMVERKSKSF